MDAMPIEFSQELSGWSAQLKSCKTSLLMLTKECCNYLKEELPLELELIHIRIFQKLFAKPRKDLSI